MERDLEQRWPLKPEYREAVIKRLVRIIADPNSTPQEVTAASKTLMAAEKQNQEDEHKVVDVHTRRRDAELAAIAADLGIEVGLIENAEGEIVRDYPGIERQEARGENKG